MREIRAPKPLPPNSLREPLVFLAGSIEMGAAENWQNKLITELEGFPVVLLNPRRDDWDASWAQRIDFPQFREQVEWELGAMERANIIAMYFSPGSKSPISLLEFGLWAGRCPEKLVVFCPDGFWRKGNVDIVCRRFGVVNCVSWEDYVISIKIRILDWVGVWEQR